MPSISTSVYFSLRPRSAIPAPPGAKLFVEPSLQLLAEFAVLARDGLHLVEADLVGLPDQRTRHFESLDLRDLALSVRAGRGRRRLGCRARCRGTRGSDSARRAVRLRNGHGCAVRDRIRDRCGSRRRLALGERRRHQHGRQRQLRPDYPLDGQRQNFLLHLVPSRS